MASKEELAGRLRDTEEEVRHLAVQELAAYGSDALELLGEALGDKSWRVRKAALEAFIAIPGPDKISVLLQGIRDEESAGRRNTSMEALIRLGDEALPFIPDLLGDNDADVRKFGVDILGSMEHPDVADMILAALPDREDNVAAAAAEYLGAKKCSKAVPGLVERIESGDFWVKYSCIKALGDIGDPAAGEAVLKAASQKDLRKVALETLGKLRVPEARQLVLEGLFSEDKGLRRIAVITAYRLLSGTGGADRDALWKSIADGADDSAAAYFEELVRSENRELREAAMTVLGAAAGRKAIRPLLAALAGAEEDEQGFITGVLGALPEGDIPELFPLLADEKAEVRRCVAAVLGRRGKDDAIPFLVRLRDDENGHVRSEAAEALGRMGNQIAVEPLVSLLHDPYPDVRQAAAEALTALGKRDEALRKLTLDFLHPLMDKQDQEQASSALRVAASLGSPEIDRRLSFALKDERVQVRRTAVEVIGMVEGPAIRDLLPLALTDEDAAVRREAVQRIGELGRDDDLSLLLPMLQDEDLWVRVRTIQAIAYYGSAEAGRVILETVGKEPPGPVRLAAIRALGGRQEQAGLEVLHEVAASGDRESRMAAIEALGMSDGADVVSRLIECTSDPEWGLRCAAAKALGSFTAEDRVRSVLESMVEKDPDQMVRKTAAGVLAASR